MDQESLVDVADKNKVKNLIVNASGHVACKVYRLEVAQPIGYVFDHNVEPNKFPDNAVDLIIEGMCAIDLEKFFVAVQSRLQQVRLLQSVEFKPDCV